MINTLESIKQFCPVRIGRGIGWLPCILNCLKERPSQGPNTHRLIQVHLTLICPV